MPDHTRGQILTLGAVVLAMALVAAGCGRLRPGVAQPTSGDPAVPAVAATDATLQQPIGSPAIAPLPQPTIEVPETPLATPDLSGIQSLLDDVDAALGADATAGGDEGSPR